MILVDRIMRYLMGDVQLPMRCRASVKKMVDPCGTCTCKVFCRNMDGGEPVYVKVYASQAPTGGGRRE